MTRALLPAVPAAAGALALVLSGCVSGPSVIEDSTLALDPAREVTVFVIKFSGGG